MSKVYITAAKRTPIGSFLGTLKDTAAPQLGSVAIKAALSQANLAPEQIDEVIMGNVLSAGVGQGPARQASLGANIPISVPAYSINMVCGSGLKAVMNAYQAIKSGSEHNVVAGGMESMSLAPYLMDAKNRSGSKMGDMKLVDHMIYDALTDAYNKYHMGITAENIVEKYNISRQEQDEFAANSQAKAALALENDAFKDEIAAVEIVTRKATIVFDKDEYPRATTVEKLAGLKPAFKKDGSVTAGNASGINDGASVCVISSDESVEKNNLKPLVEIVGIGQGGCDPCVMGLGPTPAIKQALKMANLDLKDIDVLELNEAFAAQSLGVVHELSEHFNISKEEIMAKTNLNGGAIALGHPVGASGNRILVTLIYLMKKHNYKYGLASLCIGGGMGVCVVVKNYE